MGSMLIVTCFMDDHGTRASGVRGTAGCNLQRMSWGCVCENGFLHVAFSSLEDLLKDFRLFFCFPIWPKCVPLASCNMLFLFAKGRTVCLGSEWL